MMRRERGKPRNSYVESNGDAFIFGKRTEDTLSAYGLTDLIVG